MSPLIAAMVSISPFSPINHVWFDLTNLPNIQDKIQEKIKHRTLKDLVDGGLVENYPLPFEKIAVVMSASGKKHYAVTIERSDDVLSFDFWGTGFDGPASKVVVETYLNNITMHFNPKYQQTMKASNITNYRDKHEALVGMLLFTFVAISQGAVPEINRTGYRCIDNPRNAKRIKKGKKPLFEWETVVVESKLPTPSISLGGTHASPKPHDRRGHQRRLKSGQVVYVRPHTINRHKIPTEGFIHHDYRVSV